LQWPQPGNQMAGMGHFVNISASLPFYQHRSPFKGSNPASKPLTAAKPSD
jgi:hypothetical protein